jgi:hypothetical protein
MFELANTDRQAGGSVLVKRRLLMMVLGAILALGTAIPVAFAQEAPPPRQDLGELGAEWWQWAFRKPVNANPLVGSYDGGTQCAGGGAGKVWFLGGIAFLPDSTLEPVERTCHVPANKWIFFPVINAECSTVEGNPPPGNSLEECATIFLNDTLANSSDLVATVDGQDVLGDISDNRAASGLFTFTLPKNNADFFCPDGAGGFQQCPPGPTEAAADGIWVLLPPLEPGTHTIHFGGTFFDAITLDITYILTVKGKPAGQQR